MAERNIRLTLAYDGSGFLGWQLQKKGRTVQGVMQDGLARMHGHPVHVLAAGRTDTGVHATGQVANFHSTIDSIAPDRFRDARPKRLRYELFTLPGELVVHQSRLSVRVPVGDQRLQEIVETRGRLLELHDARPSR